MNQNVLGLKYMIISFINIRIKAKISPDIKDKETNVHLI